MNINRVLRFIKDNNSRYRNYKGIGLIDDNNLRQGYWEKYWGSGKLRSKGNYVNGYREGNWEIYYSNGQLQSKGTYVNGKNDGYWEYYHYNGQLMSKGNYINGDFYEYKKDIGLYRGE